MIDELSQNPEIYNFEKRRIKRRHVHKNDKYSNTLSVKVTT